MADAPVAAGRTLSEPEFDAIKGSLLKAAPDGLSEAEFSRWIGPRLAAAVGTAEHLPAPTEGSGFGRFVSNLGQMVNPVTMAKGIWDALPIPEAVGGAGLMAPVHTAEAVGGAMVDQGKQALSAAQQGRYSEAAGHAAAAALPILGPVAAQAGEQIGQGDIAGGLGKGVGLLASVEAPRAVGAVGDLAARLKGAWTGQPILSAAEKADMLQREATNQVAQNVLAPGNPAFKGAAQQAAPQILARGWQGPRERLAQLADDAMDSGTTKMSQAVNAYGPSKPYPVAGIVKGLDGAIQDLQVGGKTIPGNEGKVSALTDLKQYLVDRAAPRSGGGQFTAGKMSLDDLRKVATDWGRQAAEKRGFQIAPTPGQANLDDHLWAAREARGIMSDDMAQSVPGMADANADYHLGKSVSDILNPAKGRPRGVNAVSSGRTGGLYLTGAYLGKLAGQTLANVPGAETVGSLIGLKLLPMLEELQYSPAAQLMKASRKMDIAKALRAGKVGLAHQLLNTYLQTAPVVNAATASAASAGTK